jgi:hypothetical protein
MKLTDSQVRGATPSDRPWKLADSRGLYLQVMPNGGRYWRFNYQFDGKQKTLALGVYPDVSLAKARERLQAAREQLRLVIRSTSRIRKKAGAGTSR